ncbi:hypothetical protein MMAN_18540 [Mycobacterium mantenii]|uniref:Uncharacterized protein n=1 Tax=Mycobacterium mantenii TaxID=560555 RepID=A0A1X0FAN9_MYCNT|nr:hypothetical protein [Mycobacterium mantenii]ORA98790.1 hypothetical protein BST30_25400 [Mycobacterium mantenii]BBY37720.1 hypothetical protein MMAN_18540 [Mycobacterium mantenii]
MSSGDVSKSLAGTNNDQIVVSYHDEGLLVGGDPAAVESYLTQLRAAAGRAIHVAEIDATTIGNVTGVAAGLASIFLDSGRYVQLHPGSIEALKNGRRVPGTDGFFRMMTRGDDGQFLAQLQWRPAALGPEAMMSAQMVAVQLALKSAIAQVEEAVRRVEGKVESVLELAKASRAGDVLGNHLTISRMVDSLERYGSLPDAYWDSVAGLGPTLNVTVEQLRDHVRRILASFEPLLPVHDRAERLRNAINDNRLGETLSLLVVAEESLYKWQRLNLARIESTQPEQLLRAIDEARELIALQLREDADIYRNAKEALDRFAKPEAIEGIRFKSVRVLVKQRSALGEELDRFAKARRHQVEAWEDFNIPKFLDAASAAVDAARTSTGRILQAAGQGLAQFGARLADSSTVDHPGESLNPKSTNESVE